MKSGRVRASPLARRLAIDAGLELRSILGTGPGGRIVRIDVEAAVPPERPSTTAKVRDTGQEYGHPSDIEFKLEMSAASLIERQRAGGDEEPIPLTALLVDAVARAEVARPECDGRARRGLRAEHVAALDPYSHTERDIDWRRPPPISEISDTLRQSRPRNEQSGSPQGFSVLVVHLPEPGAGEFWYPRPLRHGMCVCFGGIEDRVAATPEGIGVRKKLTCTVVADGNLVSLADVCAWIHAVRLRVESPESTKPEES